MTHRHTILAVIIASLVAACGSSAQSTAAPAPSTAMVDAGADLYAAHCAQCHGPDLRGTVKGPSFLSIVYEPGHHSDAAFVLAVAQGVRAHHWDFGPMPPIEGLSPTDVEAIIAFIRDRQETEGFESYP
jgi:mono/diheme cytochrome c family protein